MGVRATSREAFHSLEDLGKRQHDVLNAFCQLRCACNLDVSYFLKKAINQITPRTNELVSLGLVVESHRAITPKTGRRVIYWKLSDKGLKLFGRGQYGH